MANFDSNNAKGKAFGQITDNVPANDRWFVREEDGARVTALCGATLQETREQVGKKLGFEKPSLCRLFNKHGAEIDHMDLVMHDDLLYASAGGPFPRNMKTRPSASHGMSSMPRRVRLLILVPLLLTSCAQPQVCRVWRRA